MSGLPGNSETYITHTNKSGHVSINDHAKALRSGASHNYQTVIKKDGSEKRNQETASCLSGGAHSGGNHSDMDLISQGSNIRRLTPVECERLQGFPDNWTYGISNTQRYKCLGNAVTTTVIHAIGLQLANSLSHERN